MVNIICLPFFFVTSSKELLMLKSLPSTIPCLCLFGEPICNSNHSSTTRLTVLLTRAIPVSWQVWFNNFNRSLLSQPSRTIYCILVLPIQKYPLIKLFVIKCFNLHKHRQYSGVDLKRFFIKTCALNFTRGKKLQCSTKPKKTSKAW